MWYSINNQCFISLKKCENTGTEELGLVTLTSTAAVCGAWCQHVCSLIHGGPLVIFQHPTKRFYVIWYLAQISKPLDMTAPPQISVAPYWMMVTNDHKLHLKLNTETASVADKIHLIITSPPWNEIHVNIFPTAIYAILTGVFWAILPISTVMETLRYIILASWDIARIECLIRIRLVVVQKKCFSLRYHMTDEEFTVLVFPDVTRCPGARACMGVIVATHSMCYCVNTRNQPRLQQGGWLVLDDGSWSEPAARVQPDLKSLDWVVIVETGGYVFFTWGVDLNYRGILIALQLNCCRLLASFVKCATVVNHLRNSAKPLHAPYTICYVCRYNNIHCRQNATRRGTEWGIFAWYMQITVTFPECLFRWLWRFCLICFELHIWRYGDTIQ